MKDARLDPTIDAVVSVAAERIGYAAGLLLIDEGKLVSSATTGGWWS